DVHAALVAVEAGEIHVVVVDRLRPHAPGYVAGEGLDFDDVGAEVGEHHPAEGPGQQVTDLEHTDAGERSDHSERMLSTSVSSGVPVGYTAAAPAASRRATSFSGIVPPTTRTASAPAARSASAVFLVSATWAPLRMLSPTTCTSSCTATAAIASGRCLMPV